MDKSVKAVLWFAAVAIAFFLVTLAYSVYELKHIG